MSFFGLDFRSHDERVADEVRDAHTRGQQDCSSGNGVHKPYGVAQELFCVTRSIDEMERVNDSYFKGYESTQEQKSSGCFLTTACVRAAGLPDDCHELTVLRRFRDTFVRGLDGGEAMIREYYELAPRIVPSLSDEELKSIYEMVRHAVSQIEHGNFKEAFSAYVAMFNRLREKHLGAA